MPTTTVNRPNLRNSYVKIMAAYIALVKNIPYQEAKEKVDQLWDTYYKPKEIIYVRSIGHGQTDIVQGDLFTFLKSLKDKVVAPNGGAYFTTTEHASPVSEFLNYKKGERSAVKKKQLKALADGEYVAAKRFWYVQASIKTSMNSLPGAYASDYSIFYDKCAYNTITSTGRAMVRRSSTTTEQFLGGQFAWWSEEELINYILVNLTCVSPSDKINVVMEKYHMRHISVEELYAHYKSHFSKYTKISDYNRVKELLGTLHQHHIDFLYYYCNFKNIIVTNSESFHPIIEHLLDANSYPEIEGSKVEDVKKLPDNIKILVAVAFTRVLGGFSVDKICDEHQEYLPKLVGICTEIQKRLDDMEDIFNVFCNTDCDIPNIKYRGQFSKRNTVVLQDTDSSMFTTKSWADWYHGKEKFYVDEESLAVNALCVYWLGNIVAHVMHRFSVKLGVTDPYMKTLNFKNEFLYPVFVLTNVKKTYASIVKVQEGSILNPPKIEIKGQTLRGSSKSSDVNDFIEELLVEHILKPATQGQISAYDLIATMVRFENKMKQSLLDGEIKFLTTESLKNDKDYKNPDQPILQGFRFWEDLLSKKYGSITRPAKVIAFPCIRPDAEHLAELSKKYPRFCKRFEEWVKSHAKYPSRLVINPALDRVPDEIRGLIDIKHLIDLNIRPAYTILNQLNINCGSASAGVLFSEIYDAID